MFVSCKGQTDNVNDTCPLYYLLVNALWQTNYLFVIGRYIWIPTQFFFNVEIPCAYYCIIIIVFFWGQIICLTHCIDYSNSNVCINVCMSIRFYDEVTFLLLNLLIWVRVRFCW